MLFVLLEAAVVIQVMSINSASLKPHRNAGRAQAQIADAAQVYVTMMTDDEEPSLLDKGIKDDEETSLLDDSSRRRSESRRRSSRR